MTGRVFLDTNVVIYTIDKTGPKRERARALLGNDPTVSGQVINEAVNVCLKKLGKTREEAYRFGERIMSCCDTAGIDRLGAETAFRISVQHGLSHWDSLIIAVAVRQGCETIYSEDMQHNLQVHSRYAYCQSVHSLNGRSNPHLRAQPVRLLPAPLLSHPRRR